MGIVSGNCVNELTSGIVLIYRSIYYHPDCNHQCVVLLAIELTLTVQNSGTYFTLRQDPPPATYGESGIEKGPIKYCRPDRDYESGSGMGVPVGPPSTMVS